MKKRNKVAAIMQVYAMLNAVVCVLVGLVVGLDEAIGFGILAGGIVVSFGIYAFGEVIQILEDIKNNTAK